ncbi:hypothetical protein RJ639_038614 [Escallonia herrerae]|uniref:E3 UFM1-protein ligase 1 homolog n=1 Tax=Escallonia herrerae TaxID=1293975 RepID=A0AA89B6Z0_9ASTE|nr:hypothetical protein RJ639_038614 [Escallonia herrerae]
MDEELLELQRQFEFAQQAKSSIRLSERNVVELVQKLQHLQIIDFDLLHTVSGKEYITPGQLRLEIEAEIRRLGRVSLIDLADTMGVDLYHVEKQAQYIVSNDSSLMLINGEIIMNSYWDAVAEDVNERLQECSQIALAEIAAQFQVGSELIVTVLEPRLGTLVKGRLEGGQLYTPAYVARVNAMVRGAARGITVPMNLSALWGLLQSLLQEMEGASGVAVGGSFFQSLFNGLVKDAQILGSVRAGVHWTPSVFATAQKECVDSFFSQNSFISYEALHKLGIQQPIQFLQSRFHEGIPLATTFVHPSMIEMLDAAAEDAIERGSWTDSLSVLPASFLPQDASKILSLCPSVQKALKSNNALLLGDSYVFSNGFVKDLFDRLEKGMETLNLSVPDLHPAKDVKFGNESSSDLAESTETGSESGFSKQVLEKGSKKKKGKSLGNTKTVAAESLPDNQESVSTKSKKNQRKGKATSSSQISDSKSGSKKDVEKMKEDDLTEFSKERLMQKILTLVPDFEDQGAFSVIQITIDVYLNDPETVLEPLANHLRPMLLSSWKERRKVALTGNAQKMKQLLDTLQRKLDELYEKALDLFEDDQSASVLLHRHLLRTTATSMVDMLLHHLDMHNKMKLGIEVAEFQNPEAVSLSSGERIAIAKSFPGPLSVKAIAVVEALEGKVSACWLETHSLLLKANNAKKYFFRVETFMNALKDIAEESGLILKKLDKKLDRTLLHSYRKDLTSQVSAETDPVSLLPKVVSLLYIQVYGRALQAPGRAISVAVSRLKDKLDDSAYKILMDYQSATVNLLALMSAATGDEEDCTSDRILSKKELLETLMPALKGLVLRTS